MTTNPFAGLNSTVVATFGEVALGNPVPVWTPQGGAATPIDGVFDEPFTAVGVGAGVPLETTEPTLGVQASAVPGIRRGDAIALRGRSFRVVRLEADALGMLTLALQEA